MEMDAERFIHCILEIAVCLFYFLYLNGKAFRRKIDTHYSQFEVFLPIVYVTPRLARYYGLFGMSNCTVCPFLIGGCWDIVGAFAGQQKILVNLGIIMTNPSIHPPLSNVQAELLKLFSAEIPESHLLELKKVMAKFLLDKARDKADAIWDEKGYTDEKLQQMLDKK